MLSVLHLYPQPPQRSPPVFVDRSWLLPKVYPRLSPYLRKARNVRELTPLEGLGSIIYQESLKSVRKRQTPQKDNRQRLEQFYRRNGVKRTLQVFKISNLAT